MSRPRSPSLLSLSALFARYCNLTFGGGNPTTAVLMQELVEKRGWMERIQFGLCYALSRLTPGTNLLALCTAAGFVLRGWAGAVAALLASSLPSSLFVLAVTYLYESWAHNPIVATALRGALAAAIALMFVSSWQLARPDIRKESWLPALSIIGGSFVLASYFSVPPLRVLLVAGIVGWLLPSGSAR